MANSKENTPNKKENQVDGANNEFKEELLSVDRVTRVTA
jgi:hypothetical protein